MSRLLISLLAIGLAASIPAQAEVEMVERTQDEWYLPDTYLAEQLQQYMECGFDTETSKRLFCQYTVGGLQVNVASRSVFEITWLGGGKNYTVSSPVGYSSEKPLKCLEVQWLRQEPAPVPWPPMDEDEDEDNYKFQTLRAYIHLSNMHVSSTVEECQ